MIEKRPLNEGWQQLLALLVGYGNKVRPRGLPTLELPQVTLVVDALRPVVTIPERGLNYRFMAAEAYWILTGDDRAETIVPYNSKIAAFSDDGQRFFGAYGPPFTAQLGYVLKALLADRDTRQALMTIWRPSPPPTKDPPCTVAVGFQIREDKLNVHVFMRSSDAWLGVPYDCFNFCMMGYYVIGLLGLPSLAPGCLYLTMASSHLYVENLEAAERCMAATPALNTPPVPLLYTTPQALLNQLKDLRERGAEAKRWWAP